MVKKGRAIKQKKLATGAISTPSRQFYEELIWIPLRIGRAKIALRKPSILRGAYLSHLMYRNGQNRSQKTANFKWLIWITLCTGTVKIAPFPRNTGEKTHLAKTSDFVARRCHAFEHFDYISTKRCEKSAKKERKWQKKCEKSAKKERKQQKNVRKVWRKSESDQKNARTNTR